MKQKDFLTMLKKSYVLNPMPHAPLGSSNDESILNYRGLIDA